MPFVREGLKARIHLGRSSGQGEGTQAYSCRYVLCRTPGRGLSFLPAVRPVAFWPCAARSFFTVGPLSPQLCVGPRRAHCLFVSMVLDKPSRG